jgi:phage terminase large subunit GpA-like protein
MVSKGRWLPTRTPDEPGLAAFHLPATVSILGATTLTSLVEKWLAARKDGREATRSFINTVLGEVYEDRDQPRIEAHVLLTRRESYGDGIEVPAFASVLTAGVDVQIDRLEVQVVSWGEYLERAVVAWTLVPGDPRRPETWEALSEVLAETYIHKSGVRLPVHATCVDAGFLPKDAVLPFVAANQHRRIYATKGDAHPRPSEPLVMRSAKPAATRQVRLFMLNTHAGKAELNAALALPPGGPSTVHFNDALPESYFVQLTAEKLVRRYVAGVAYESWVCPEGARNEALDTAILCRAAFDILSGGRHDALVRKFAEQQITGGKK